MRDYGAAIADLALLVVSADDGVDDFNGFLQYLTVNVCTDLPAN
jgi:hypothetical protein